MKSYAIIACAVLLLIAGVMVHAADERECPMICPANYEPTCGYNGKCYHNFGNECGLKAYACTTRQDIQKVDFEKCNNEKEKCAGSA